MNISKNFEEGLETLEIAQNTKREQSSLKNRRGRERGKGRDRGRGRRRKRTRRGRKKGVRHELV